MNANSPLDSNFQALTKEEKQKILWEKILNSQYSDENLPSRKPSLLKLIKTLFLYKNPNYTLKTFTHADDEFEPGRKKILHPFGSVAKMKFQPQAGHSLTGIFQNEALGLMRISSAKPIKAGIDTGMIPGVGLKFLIDGKPSVNLVAVFSLNDIKNNQNIFSTHPSNVVIKPNGWMFKIIVWLSEPTIKKLNNPALSYLKLPLTDFVSLTSSGEEVQSPKDIFKIVLEPQIKLSEKLVPDFRIKLRAIKPNTVIYKCHIQETEENSLTYIGDIINTSEFVPSKFGDERLFFQHPGLIKERKRCPFKE